MEKRILLTIAYDGTNYYGWQRQTNESLNTVQREFERGCTKLFGKPIECIGVSRTDRGVHAIGQRATIDVDTPIPTEKIPLALNSKLPDDIVVTAAVDVEMNFHPRHRTTEKTYEYKIYNNRYRNPMLRNYSEFIYEKLDIIKMQKACLPFIGKHDFRGFCSAGGSAKTTVRTITDLNVTQDGSIITIRVTGDGFLYNMVRIIAGTLIYVGMGRIKYNEISQILESGDRKQAGKTALPQGLTLVEIKF